MVDWEIVLNDAILLILEAEYFAMIACFLLFSWMRLEKVKDLSTKNGLLNACFRRVVTIFCLVSLAV